MDRAAGDPHEHQHDPERDQPDQRPEQKRASTVESHAGSRGAGPGDEQCRRGQTPWQIPRRRSRRWSGRRRARAGARRRRGPTPICSNRLGRRVLATAPRRRMQAMPDAAGPSIQPAVTTRPIVCPNSPCSSSRLSDTEHARRATRAPAGLLLHRKAARSSSEAAPPRPRSARPCRPCLKHVTFGYALAERPAGSRRGTWWSSSGKGGVAATGWQPWLGLESALP